MVVKWSRKTEKPTIAVSFEVCPGDRQTKECVMVLAEKRREKRLNVVRHDVTQLTHDVTPRHWLAGHPPYMVTSWQATSA